MEWYNSERNHSERKMQRNRFFYEWRTVRDCIKPHVLMNCGTAYLIYCLQQILNSFFSVFRDCDDLAAAAHNHNRGNQGDYNTQGTGSNHNHPL